LIVFCKNGPVMAKRLPFAALAVAGLLLSSCDQNSPATSGPQSPPIAKAADPSPAAASKPAPAPAVKRVSFTPAGKPIAAKKPGEPESATPEPGSPVTATVKTDKSTVRAGEDFTLTVDVQVAEGWHIYAMDRPTGPATATEIQLNLPAGLESAGKWTSPEPSMDNSSPGEAAFVYEKPVAFQCPVRVARGTAAGSVTIGCVLRYQVCNRASCHAPAELKLQTAIQVAP
jgi:DsbC/DsbD-like thiol-disulfide interchange protein